MFCLSFFFTKPIHVLIFVHRISINNSRNLQMNKFITLLTCLVVSSVTTAATSNASSFYKDPDILLASNDKTWSYAAYSPNGFAMSVSFTIWAKAVFSKSTMLSIAKAKLWPCQDFKFCWAMTLHLWVM